MKFFTIFSFIALLVLATEARLPKQLQKRWGFIDTDEFNRGAQRIVKGQLADLKEAPFQTSLQQDYIILKSHICGGSLISPRTVVTAAHCTDGQRVGSIINRYGTNKQTTAGKDGDRKTSRFIQHPNYNPSTIENDISLIILDKKVSPSDAVEFITYNKTSIEGGVDVTVYGWGLTEGNSQKVPENLQKGDLKTLTNEKCDEIWGGVNPIKQGMLCAFSRDEQPASTTACNGDSGGPLIVDENGKKVLVGIVSWGENGCKASAPNVFTRVSEYASWIDSNRVDK